MENRLNFSDEVKQGLSQNAMTEETARKFLIENGVPKEQVDAHISSLKSLINAQKSRTREHTLDALLTLYSYISGKGFALYDTPFVNSSERNNSTNVPSQTEKVSTTPVVNSPDKTATTPQKEEKKTEDAAISQGIKSKNTDKKTQTKSEPKVMIFQETNRTYDESLPAERQKSVREYFANRGNETIVVKWKEVKIATLLNGNALKDGKIGDATRALEEKMKSEKKKDAASWVEVRKTKTSQDSSMKSREPENKKPQDPVSKKTSKTESKWDYSYPEVKPTNEWQITIEESLTETYDDVTSLSQWTKINSIIWSQSTYVNRLNNVSNVYGNAWDKHQKSVTPQNPYGIPQNGTHVNGFSGNLGNNHRVDVRASGRVYYDKQNNSVTIKGSDGSQTCAGTICM